MTKALLAPPAVGAPDERAGDEWRDRPAAQQPDWPDPSALRAVVRQLAGLPPLVTPEECDTLTDRLGQVARGRAFLLQGGDCAETFAGTSAAAVRRKLETLLQMAVVFSYAASMPVVKVGRMAGQFAKPRSAPTETRDGLTLPVYRGDAVNGVEFTPEARRPDPGRLHQAYQASAATLALIRAFVAGGYADLRQVHAWNQDFVARSPVGQRYERLADEIDRALRFLDVCHVDLSDLRTVELFTSHEGLLLDYESALTRTDPRTGGRYAGSGHLLWVGERTRALDGAHVAYLAGVRNPVAVKLGPSVGADEVLGYVERLDPDRVPGRLTLVVRMGAKRIRDRLPGLVQAVTAAGAEVVWVSDPMHGNTITAPSGHKTRQFDDILDEVAGFFEVHHGLGTHPGGVHVELTGDDVAECLGGGSAVALDDLGRRYESACDPRLNRGQSLDLAFRAAELFRGPRGTARRSDPAGTA
ncbi:class II 3-deoxy-7-phosphoheptulonate synthase [Plantactinospora endophytica]|uniref:Phospho-2-dehydro-3-deoxyheptonate aldolase n=1 Tax=Plantactinospora endophytica TaxID=673535 RepID=A0ABQ4E6T8_9ACTN|nr:3-deoxy-7-phosphoheptulonate synthase class II [Plantactinospora endophytica]GIG90419.1 phospho-2-dehydro-3-deoxyheptonate aldolase [Plantactinospora endophytica]